MQLIMYIHVTTLHIDQIILLMSLSLWIEMSGFNESLSAIAMISSSTNPTYILIFMTPQN